MIDKKFMLELEGWSLRGYVPDPKRSMSGATIANGLDLAHTNPFMLDIPEYLAKKLAKYHGIYSQDAVEFLEENPLTLTSVEAELLAQAIYDLHLGEVERVWNHGALVPWEHLCASMQTIVFSVLYQYGGPKRVPKFWKFATSLRWRDVIKELRDFGDRYPTRRNKEADYLEAHLDG